MSDTRKTTKPNVPNLRFPGFSGEWELKRIDEISPLQRGFDLPSQSLQVGSVPVVYSNGIMNYHNESKCVAPGIVTGRSGTIGRLTYIESGPYWPHNTSLWVTDFKGNIPLFVYYLLEHIDLSRFSSGSGVPTLNRNDVHAFKTCIPSVEEQHKIADCLSIIDKRISIQNKVIEKYESLIKALRHHLFSTLESVKEVPVADLLSYEQPTKYIVSDTEYSNNTDLTPVLTANKAFILGYTDEVEGIYDKGPCIILDDFTLDSKIVEFPFKVKSSAIKILSAKTTVSLRYIFEYLKFLDLNTEEHKRHYIAEIEPMSIELPEEDTIKSIAFLFDLMDKRRKGLERGQQLLKSQKDYLLREIFI